MTNKFLTYGGEYFRILLETPDGVWLASYEITGPPLFVYAENLHLYPPAPAPDEFVQAMQREKKTEAEKIRLEIIQPLLDDDRYIMDNKIRRAKAAEIADQYHTTARRILRLYYKYISTGLILESKPRLARDNPIFEQVIRKYYFSSKGFSLRATYELMLLEHYTTLDGLIAADAPSFDAFRHYFYRQGYHRDPARIISREGLSYYQRNHRMITGTASGWRQKIGSYQMDATEADIYLVSCIDHKSIIGRPIVYLAVDTATQLIVGLHVGLEGGDTAVMACVANAAADKVAYCARFGITIQPGDWPSCGVPREIITDKGRDFCGQRIEELSLRYGVDVINLPPYRPDRKGLVEKSFDLLQQRYKPLLRGKGVIEPDAQERWATDYRSQAVLDIDQFTQVLIHAIIYLNAGRVLSCGKTPAQLWLETQDSLMEVDQQELYCMGLKRERGEMTRYGIKYHGLCYLPDAPDLLRVGDTCTIAVDPDNTSQIFVVDEGRYYTCHLAERSRGYQGLNLREVEEKMKKDRQKVRESTQQEQAASVTATRHIKAVIQVAVDTSTPVKEKQLGSEIHKNRNRERR